MGSQEYCIYRVPSPLREVKPEAYTPRMVIIGPLHHSVKPRAYNHDIEANMLMEDLKNSNSSYLEYLMMEGQKKRYKEAFIKRIGQISVDEMKRTIQANIEKIRGSYAVPTSWISSPDFVDLILGDSIFILELSLRHWDKKHKTSQPSTSIGTACRDLTVDKTFFTSTVIEDLILLENQLPYFILEELFDPIKRDLCGNDDLTLYQLILNLFSKVGKIKENTKFMHFTDMHRCVYEESLDQNPDMKGTKGKTHTQNAENLSHVGVEFKVWKDEYSLDVAFKEGCLTMPSFPADENSDIILRNVIAYEQCHMLGNALTSEYIYLMNFLVTSDKDVEVLDARGLIANGIGRSSLVVKMINELGVGVRLPESTVYHGIAMKLRAHCKSRRKRFLAKLGNVYYSDCLTGTATTAAVILLFLTMVATGASLYQAIMTQP